ncbi:hypothetical protein TruAng_000902 [Truncatella angustata]|nr:hypothetical protein TruAng_000902 [Truncatella angustata]
MSSHQANTGLARMRSLRLPGKSPLTAPKPTTGAAHIPSTTSHVSLFLTNLRLLDLDQEADWPDISPATFSAKDAAGGLKNRIQCVEWALYHLFMLWDQEEARNKLKPFYPPMDQVQSINLRAALLRCLEQAKRNGALGRDAVLRKTMLDECKGDRFEELMAAFSSAVLKKLVAERALNAGLEYRPTISESIALENYGYSGERTELNALLLAHKVSLAKQLRDKNVSRSRYKDFEDLLALKQRNLATRKEQVKAAAGSEGNHTVADKLKDQTREMIKTNWLGDDRWADTLMYGDTKSQQGGLLAGDFDQLWAGIRAGKLSDIEHENVGLLEQLDLRVRLQRSRLEKWQGFRQELFGDLQPMPKNQEEKAKGQVQGVDLGFTTHKTLQPVLRPIDLKASDGPAEYARLLDTMRTDLANVGKPRVPNFFKLRGDQVAGPSSQHLTLPTNDVDTISDLSEWEDEPEEAKPVPKTTVPTNADGPSRSNSQFAGRQPLKRPAIRQRHTDDSNSARPGFVDSTQGRLAPNASQPRSSANYTQQAPSRGASGRSSVVSKSVTGVSLAEQKVLLVPEPKTLAPNLPGQSSRTSEVDEDTTPLPPQPVSPTQAVADQILASITNASPSPDKKLRHTLSLAERTRMTMTRTKSFDPDDEPDASLLSPSVARSMRRNKDNVPSSGDVTPEEEDDLAARTRRSMANFQAAQQKAQLDRRRSERKGRPPQRKDSYFPKVQEEGEEIADASVMDSLLEVPNIDMETVFKSRPKMRTSPAPGPRRRWDEDDLEA